MLFHRLLMSIVVCFALFAGLLTGRIAYGQEEPWVGRIVFYKEGAEAKVGDASVKLDVIEFPAMVEQEKGEWVWLSRAWLKKTDCMEAEEAVAYYTKVVERNPKSVEALRRRAACLAQTDDQAKALADLDEAIRLDPKDAKSMHARGRTKMEFAIVNQMSRAMSPIGDIAGGIIGGILGVPPPAEGEEKKKPAIEEDDSGLTKEDRELLEAAKRDLDEAIRLDGKLSTAYYDRAMTKSQLSDIPGAIQDLDETIKLDAKNGDAYGMRAAAKLELDDAAGAIRDLDVAIKLNPKDVASYRTRAGAREILKDYRGAIADYDVIMKIEPEDSFALHDRGRAKMGAKDYAGALKDFDEVIGLGDPVGLAKISKVFLLSTAAEASARKPDEALKLSEEFLVNDLPQGEALSAKACALAAAGKFAEAIEMETSAGKDAIWLQNESMSGGAHSAARIAAWKAKKLWHP